MDDSYKDRFDKVGHQYNSAGSKYPVARESERLALLSRLKGGKNLVIVDAPAGGGYVAEGIKASWPSARVVCIEPSKVFSDAIPISFERRNESLHKTSLRDASVDAVASLAGLHHLSDKASVFREWHRILKPGGQIVVADVAMGTKVGEFLNGFVDEFTPNGHDGLFFEPSEFTKLLNDTGFEMKEDELCQVPWVFADERSMVHFCKSLFSIEQADESAILAALEKVGVLSIEGTVLLEWELQYAVGRKPN